jgi:hypothetical protein
MDWKGVGGGGGGIVWACDCWLLGVVGGHAKSAYACWGYLLITSLRYMPAPRLQCNDGRHDDSAGLGHNALCPCGLRMLEKACTSSTRCDIQALPQQQYSVVADIKPWLWELAACRPLGGST